MKLKIYDTAIILTTDDVPADAASERRFRAIRGHFHRRDFTVGKDPRTAKDYPIISRFHYRARRGDLEARLELCGRSTKIESSKT
jgi:hypothetical protein